VLRKQGNHTEQLHAQEIGVNIHKLSCHVRQHITPCPGCQTTGVSPLLHCRVVPSGDKTGDASR
jgi:hypothetical protein